MATMPWIGAAPVLGFSRRDDGVVVVAGELDELEPALPDGL